MNTTIKKLERSEVEITSAIDATAFSSYEAKALLRIGERMEIPGFRKGKAPADTVKQNTNPMMLLEEMAELAINEAYPKILEENKIDAIGRPEIFITKIAQGETLEFKIKTAVLPQMEMPDYNKIATDEIAKIKKENEGKEVLVTDEELDKVILDLRKMKAQQNMPAHEHADGEEHAHPEITEEELPAFDDAFAQSFGKFENVEDFKNKIKSNIKMEKEMIAKDKVRLAIVEHIISETKGEIPQILIDTETDKMIYRLEADVTGMGLKLEDYFKQIGKTEQDLRKEMQAESEKRAKLAMIVHTISQKENIKPEKEEVEAEVKKITEMYKDADPVRAQVYIEQMLTNEKVFAFLENR